MESNDTGEGRHIIRSAESEFSDLMRNISSGRELKFNKFEEKIGKKNTDSKFSLNLEKDFNKKNIDKDKFNLNLLKIEKIDIKKKEFSNFESELTNLNLDRYIEDLFRNHQRDVDFEQNVSLIRRSVSSDLGGRRIVSERISGRYFSSRGLSARSFPKGESYMVNIVAEGENLLEGEENYTRIDFMPGGRARRDPSKITDSLEIAVKGMTELVAAIDSGKVNLPSVFVGDTNINMALISQRLGFRIVDSCRNPDGTIDKSRTSFTVIGRIDDIRQRLAEFAEMGLEQKLSQRNMRLRKSPQPA